MFYCFILFYCLTLAFSEQLETGRKAHEKQQRKQGRNQKQHSCVSKYPNFKIRNIKLNLPHKHTSGFLKIAMYQFTLF